MQLVYFDAIGLFWCRVDEAYNVLAKFRSPADDIDKELQLISDAAEEEKVSQTQGLLYHRPANPISCAVGLR